MMSRARRRRHIARRPEAALTLTHPNTQMVCEGYKECLIYSKIVHPTSTVLE
jgi:hypothetical protein